LVDDRFTRAREPVNYELDRDERHMKSNDDFNDAKTLATQLVILFFFILLAGVALYYAESYFSAKRSPEGLFFSIFLIIFGSIHMFFSNALSFLYNLQKKVIPFAPVVSPRFLRTLGVVLLGMGVVVFLYYSRKAV